jgi:hypothetical protein
MAATEGDNGPRTDEPGNACDFFIVVNGDVGFFLWLLSLATIDAPATEHVQGGDVEAKSNDLASPPQAISVYVAIPGQLSASLPCPGRMLSDMPILRARLKIDGRRPACRRVRHPPAREDRPQIGTTRIPSSPSLSRASALTRPSVLLAKGKNRIAIGSGGRKWSLSRLRGASALLSPVALRRLAMQVGRRR